MALVYINIPKSALNEILECGMKLSEYATSKIPVDMDEKYAIKGFLSPRDIADSIEDISDQYGVILADVPSKYVYVCDGDLREIASRDFDFLGRYEKSVINIESYKTGMFRRPEVMILSTIMAEQLKPVTDFENVKSSEELYYDAAYDYFTQKCNVSSKEIMSTFFSRLREEYALRSATTWNDDVVLYGDDLARTWSYRECDLDKIYEKLADAED